MLHNNDLSVLNKYTPNYLFPLNGNLHNSLRSCFPVLSGLEDFNVLTFWPDNFPDTQKWVPGKPELVLLSCRLTVPIQPLLT